MELPMVKNYEDAQEQLKGELNDILAFVISTAQGKTILPNEVQVAWEFPPIITQDVVKWMAALAQFTQQIAPANPIVKREAIKRGLAVLNIPNRDELMDEINAAEEKVQAQKEAQQQAALDAQMLAAKNGGMVPGAGGPPGNLPGARPVGSGPGAPVAGAGKPAGGGQRAGGGPNGASLTSNPNQQRLVAGKSEKEAPTGPRSRRQ
jgi:hypothetical protein